MHWKFKKQSGIALITALIITSVAVSLAGVVMYRQQIHIRLSTNISHLEQSYLYAKGMEDWAGTILQKSHKKHKDYDSLDDDWAVLLPPIPIPGGVMKGQLYDLQARINLNSLGHPKPRPKGQGQQPPGRSQPPPGQQPPGGQGRQRQGQNQQQVDIAEIATRRLVNLMKQLDPEQDMGPPENFVDILSDWIDKDQSTRDFGAESDYYQSLEPAYFSADTILASPTEIRLLKDMKKKLYKKLLEHVSTLPITTKTPVNVNTASLEVLKALGFDPASAEAIKKEVEKRPFRNQQEFVQYLNNNAEVTKPVNFDQNKDIEEISVKSSFFLLQGSVMINNARLFINSVLERKNGKISVIMRDFSNP